MTLNIFFVMFTLQMIFEVIRSAEASVSLHTRIYFQKLICSKRLPPPTSTSAFIIRSSIVEYNQFKRLTSALTDDKGSIGFSHR